MSWVITERGTFTQSYSSNSWVTTSFTPGANSLLLLIVATGSTAITSVSGHDGGASWVQLWNEVDVPIPGYNVEIWGCFTPDSPSNGTVTMTIPYENNIAADLLEIQEDANGVDVSGTVANAFGARDIDYGYDIRTPQLTLAAFANTNNLAFVFHYVLGTSGNVTVETGFTPLNYIEWSLSLYPYYKGSEENTIDGTCADYNYNAFWGVEIKQSSASSSNIKKIGETDLADIASIGGIPIGDIKKIGEEDI